MTVALVVGGGSGIGAAVAELHRARGDEVVVWDRAGAVDVICDVRDDDAVAAAADVTVAARASPPSSRSRPASATPGPSSVRRGPHGTRSWR